MKSKVSMGMNRTGIDTSPELSRDMKDFAQKTSVAPLVTAKQTDRDMRTQYLEESEHIGSVPLPLSMKGAAKAGVDRLKGARSEVLIDKLGERVAFERMGARLYEQIILKCENDPIASEIVSIDKLREFHDQEVNHFRLLCQVMRDLGADPTAETPCADTAGVAGSGLLKVISDPRSSVAQSLQALLTAEATDNAGWELLFELCEELAYDKFLGEFERAQIHEEEHLSQIQEYLRLMVMRESRVA